MQKHASMDPEGLACRNSKCTQAGKHSCSSVLLISFIILQWLAIAAMCYIVFFYIKVLKEDIHIEVLTMMKNITISNLPTTGSDTFKSSVIKSEKPIAHFTALAGAAELQNTSSHLLFEHRQGHAFRTSDMKYNETGYLVIPASGVYFIYAQVTFKCLQGYSKLSQQLSATILKKNNQYPEPEILLKSYAKPQGDDFVKLSTYQAGVFKLNADDDIYVAVSHNLHTQISEIEHDTYFGAFLLEPSTSE